MGLYSPFGPDYQWSYSNVGATRPVLGAAYGTTITPGTLPTMGAWTVVATAANVAQDVYGIYLAFNNGFTSATTRQILVNVGVDNAGGTSYVVKIPNLIAGHCAPYGTIGEGVTYFFPLYIPAGSQIAIQASSTLTTTFAAKVVLYGQPRRPEALRVGSKVVAFGVNTTTGAGTAVTSGTTAEGGWTQIGTATTRNLWWWQTAYTCADTSMAAVSYHVDVASGDATTKKILLENDIFISNTTEQIGKMASNVNCYNGVATGDLIYARMQCSGIADVGTSIAIYGLGD